MRPHFVKARVQVSVYPNGSHALFRGPRCIGRGDEKGRLTDAAPVQGPLSGAQLRRCWRSSPTATAREACRSGPASSCSRPSGCACRGGAREPASAGRRSGAGSSASPRRASTACCATRPARPARAPLRGQTVAAGAGADLLRAAGRGDALDRPGHGRGRRDLAALGAADLGGARPAAAPAAHLQALARPRTSPPRSRTSSASTWIRPPTPWCCRSTRRARSRRWTAPSPACRSSPGSAGTMTHDYKRHGTTTLFAALNVLDGTVLGRCMQRHRHQEFIRFLNAVERAVPAGKVIHAIARQLRHPQAPEGHAPGWPPSALDLPLHPDLGLLAQRRRGLLLRDHPSAPPPRRLPLASSTCRRPSNATSPSTTQAPKPFVWTKPATAILAKLATVPEPSV